MAHDEDVKVEENHHDHHEVVPNPDYDGPGQHCLPPPVREGGLGQGIYFILLIAALILFAAYLGVRS